jgi:hypothetical protein
MFVILVTTSFSKDAKSPKAAVKLATGTSPKDRFPFVTLNSP